MGNPIDAWIEGIPSMGSYSVVMQEIEAAVSNPQSTLSTVGEIIEKDPDLTARLLRLGNSAFFGFPNRLETVSETISLIGIQQVQDLISASTIVEIFEGISSDLVNMESFWKHSMACGVVARLLAMDRSVPKPEKYFVAGLLHDVGRLVLYSRAPEKARRVFQLYQSESMLLREAEYRTLGFDHGEIAEHLLRSWNYPLNLINAVRYHHHPMSAGIFQMEASLVHLADYIVNAMQLGSSGERNVPPLQAKAWDRLNLEPSMLESLMESIDEQVAAVEQAFLVAEPPNPAP
jgi:putative nucleotidyltransferase with HDIG domain